MDPVPAGTGQQPRIVAGYNLFVVSLREPQTWPWPVTTTAWCLGSMIRHAECHTLFKIRGAVTRSPLPGFVKVADSKPFRMELPLGTSRRAPSARMMLRNYLTGTWSKKAHILVIVNTWGL